MAVLMRSAARFGQDWRTYIPSLSAGDAAYAVAMELVEVGLESIEPDKP